MCLTKRCVSRAAIEQNILSPVLLQPATHIHIAIFSCGKNVTITWKGTWEHDAALSCTLSGFCFHTSLTDPLLLLFKILQESFLSKEGNYSFSNELKWKICKLLTHYLSACEKQEYYSRWLGRERYVNRKRAILLCVSPVSIMGQ